MRSRHVFLSAAVVLAVTAPVGVTAQTVPASLAPPPVSSPVRTGNSGELWADPSAQPSPATPRSRVLRRIKYGAVGCGAGLLIAVLTRAGGGERGWGCFIGGAIGVGVAVARDEDAGEVTPSPRRAVVETQRSQVPADDRSSAPRRWDAPSRVGGLESKGPPTLRW